MVEKIAVIGNCQADVILKFIKLLRPELQLTKFTHADALNEKNREKNENILEESDIIFSNPFRSDKFGRFSYNYLKSKDNSYFFQPFSFPAFHPDCVYIGIKQALPKSSPVGDYSSSIAVYSFLHGLSVEETLQMYNHDVYQELGFFDIWAPSRKSLLENSKQLGLDLTDAFENWKKRGLFMHVINHPFTFVMLDITKMLLSSAGLTVPSYNPEKFLADRGANDIVWPVYPEIAEKLGLKGEMLFKMSDRLAPPDERPKILELEEFIHGSFERYKNVPLEKMICRSICKNHDESMEVMGELITRYRQQGARFSNSDTTKQRGDHPYKELPQYQFWRKGISSVPMLNVDPVVSMPFSISITDKVATAGSCFAQHIAARLDQQGFNYFVAETAPNGMSEDEARAKNYGIFSARYGNIYTTRQLVQLFDRAYGHFTPADSDWVHPVSGFVDPFRPQIVPEGFADKQEVEEARELHFAAVRQIFEQADVFVFTLGLTEGWRSKKDGAVFPLAPGVAGGVFDAEAYEFVNFTVEEVTSDLNSFINKLRSVNSDCRILLTVSPVSLIATYEPRHVLVSTILSKSVLRVAAEQACKSHERAHYFPSYEIIVGNYNKGAYFEEDMRSVRKEGVDHVMKLFFKHLTNNTHLSPDLEAIKLKSDIDFDQRMEKLDEIICDEEAIGKSYG